MTDPNEFDVAEWCGERVRALVAQGFARQEALLMAINGCAGDLGEPTHCVWRDEPPPEVTDPDRGVWFVQGAERVNDPLIVIVPYDNGWIASGKRAALALARLLHLVWMMSCEREERT